MNFDPIENPDQTVYDTASHINVFQRHAFLNAKSTFSCWADIPLHVIDNKVNVIMCNDIASKYDGEFKQMGESGWMAIYHDDQKECLKIAKLICSPKTSRGYDLEAKPIMRITMNEKPFAESTEDFKERFPYEIDFVLGNKTYKFFFWSLIYAIHLSKGGQAIEGVDYGKLDKIMADKTILAERVQEYQEEVEKVTEQVAGARDIRPNQNLSFTGWVHSVAYRLADGKEKKIENLPVKYYDIPNPYQNRDGKGKDRMLPIISMVFNSFQDALNDKEGQQAAPQKSMAEITALIAENLNPALKRKIINDPAGVAKILEISLDELTQATQGNIEAWRKELGKTL